MVREGTEIVNRIRETLRIGNLRMRSRLNHLFPESYLGFGHFGTEGCTMSQYETISPKLERGLFTFSALEGVDRGPRRRR